MIPVRFTSPDGTGGYFAMARDEDEAESLMRIFELAWKLSLEPGNERKIALLMSRDQPGSC